MDRISTTAQCGTITCVERYRCCHGPAFGDVWLRPTCANPRSSPPPQVRANSSGVSYASSVVTDENRHPGDHPGRVGGDRYSIRARAQWIEPCSDRKVQIVCTWSAPRLDP